MRNLSVVAAVVVVLLNSSCTSCLEEGDAHPKYESESGPKPKPVNAFRLLNDYLADHAESSDFAENIEAAKKYSSEPQPEPAVLELAKLFVETDSEDACQAESIINEWEFMTALRSYEPQFDRGRTTMMRLGTLVYENYPRARADCFEQFEEQWLKDWDRVAVELDEIENLDYSIALSDAQFEPTRASSLPNNKLREATMLVESMKLYTDEKLRDSDQMLLVKPTKELKDVDPEKWAHLEALERAIADRPVLKMTKKEALRRVDDLVYIPCRTFVEHRESKAILEPVGKLAHLIEPADMPKKPFQGRKMLSFLWASRYFSCKTTLLHTPRSYLETIIKDTNGKLQLVEEKKKPGEAPDATGEPSEPIEPTEITTEATEP